MHIGAPCPQWLKREWIGWLGAPAIVEVYAGTESFGSVAPTGASQGLAVAGTVTLTVVPPKTGAQKPGPPTRMIIPSRTRRRAKEKFMNG